MNDRVCKRCLLHESAEDDVLEDIRKRINKLSDGERADEKTYSQRLEKCRECEQLISGVCMKCGCYVEFRAAFKKNVCPDVSQRKW